MATHEKFSPALFALTVLATLTALLAALRICAPAVWAVQFHHSLGSGLAAFVVLTLVNCIVEYFFHRYVLHTPAVPLLHRLYRQHTLHHALTRIGRKRSPGGVGFLFIENVFPITEPEQGEASFFPWYSLGIFSLLFVPLFALLQWTLPSFPWFFGGFAALAVSLTLYETLHALNHWPFERWQPLIEHPRWGRLWRPAYAFHLRHHAVTDCNESISGFFGLPLADWVFGTCVIPKTLYADAEEWTPEKFRSPRPRAIIRHLDLWADHLVKRRRLLGAQGAARPEVNQGGREPADLARTAPSLGEEIAGWVSHGLGLALSIAGLTLLIVFSSLRGDAWHVVTFTVFGLTLLALCAISTLYHAVRSQVSRSRLEKLTQAAIFLLIAGTYTPFLLTNLRGPWGWTGFGVIWGLCGAGAVFKVLFGQRFPVISSLAYLFVGWLVVMALLPLMSNFPPAGLWLLLAGGLCYAGGVAFRRWRRLPYREAAWHTLVLGGGTCHLLAMLLFLLPRAS